MGDPPANHDLEAPAEDAGTPPTNHDFEAGDFTGWTRSGTTSIQSDTQHGYYAKLQSSGIIISSAFTVDSSAQSFVFDVGYLSTNGSSWVKVYALTGPTYGTSTLLADVYCNSCGYWSRYDINASQYLGQSIKLKFSRYLGDVGIDDVSAQIVFPYFTQTGSPQRLTEAGGNTYAYLNSASITSAAFTVDAAAQFATVRIDGMDSLGRSQYKVYVISGPSFGTSTLATIGYAAYGWQSVRFNVSPWQSQQIKIKVEEVAYRIGADDIGLQSVDIPDWSVTGDTSLVPGGPSGNYIRTPGNVTSSPFTLDVDVQQLSLAYKGDSVSSIFYLELLRGPDFSQVTDLAGPVGADQTQWKTLKVGVSLYAGETVKLRIRQYFGWGLFDNAGLPEITVPGRQLMTNDPVGTGEDSNGTYVTPFKSGGVFNLRSVDIAPGIIDRPNHVDQKYYAISYDIGYSTANVLWVIWYNSSGQSWVVYGDTADTPTGYRTGYAYVADFMGQKGYFRVQLAGGGKVYSLADNIARQQMREPFSQKVGLKVDTSTGSFGFEDADLALEGRMPLVLNRYYNGHSDRCGPLGCRWTHSFDTHLEFASYGDTGVVFGSGGEEFFIWSVYGTFSPADARVHDELVKNPDGSYTLKTKENLNYNFDSAGKLTTIEDLNGNTVVLTYDGNGRLASVADPDGRTLTFAYDANGRLASVTDPMDAVVSYSYDANGDLTSVTDPEDGVRTYTYSRHRLTQVVDQNGKTLFTNILDSVNRVIQQTDALDHTISISYDTPAKGVTQVTDPEDNTAQYYYDVAHRTTDKTDPLGRTISYVYDSAGNLQKVVDPLFNEWEFAYDSSGDLTDSTDPLGNPISITYNPKHLPTTITDARGYVTTLTYDDDGNLTSMTDPLDNVTTYTYDDGNLIAADEDTFTWDYADRLTEATVDGTTTGYTYDGDGTRVSKTVDDVPTSYLWDSESYLPQMVDDGTNAYLHADGVLAQIDGDGEPTYVLDDAVGSVRGLTDSDGTLTGTADYDVFGEVRASSGASSVFGFTGEQFDSETGFTFLRARYLDPRLGRFLSMDSVQPNAPGTQGYNPYAYVGNNPTTWVDPSGHIVIVAAGLILYSGPIIGLGLIIIPVAATLICALTPACHEAWQEAQDIVRRYGSKAREVGDSPPDVPDIARRVLGKGRDVVSGARRAVQCLDLRSGCMTKLLEDLLADACKGRTPPRYVYHEGIRVRLVENVEGPCAEMLRRTGYFAFTVGRTIFSLGSFEGPEVRDILLHELEHVDDYEEAGDLYLPTYLGPAAVQAAIQCARDLDFSIKCLHDRNFFEQVMIQY